MSELPIGPDGLNRIQRYRKSAAYKEANKRRRQKLSAAGKCERCGKKRVKGKSRRQFHLDYQAAYQAGVRAKAELL